MILVPSLAGSNAVNDSVACSSSTTVALRDDSCHESDVSLLR
jgi:hypothetical protein